jgi:hypothetical protein
LIRYTAERLSQGQQTPGGGIGQVPVRGARDECLLDILGRIVVIGDRDGEAEHLPLYRSDTKHRPGDGELDAISTRHRHGSDRHIAQTACLRLRIPEIGLHVLTDIRPAWRNPNLVIGSGEAKRGAIGIRAGRQENLDAVTFVQIRPGGILHVFVVEDFDGQVQVLAVPADPVGSLQVVGAAPVGLSEDDVLQRVLRRRPLIPRAIDRGRRRERGRFGANPGWRCAGESGRRGQAGWGCGGDSRIGGQQRIGG